MGTEASRETHMLTDERPTAAGRAVPTAKATRYETPGNNDGSDDDEPRMPLPVRVPLQATRTATQQPPAYSLRAPPAMPAHLRPKIHLPRANGVLPGDLAAAPTIDDDDDNNNGSLLRGMWRAPSH
ncbi:hypothetical protein SDRG_00619 [Saprolegnia diclina VS20]|uniref:Uncharacterized protein n=1 Tax=Saprolegnia diclina (strain VS20) TaxID=1156394 RepID=T0R458_SAPDV|nr:hypothetical protein SDRG_00619 [Saprolegnia diclina VS20]EQC41756.1 hypothetical protein SDRG_00619 [Saprolegnia diclina VS20]|eukprot:XP_008604325.1 hypothetical protein SDRG_00619 [Saprolegnia diclina VS20]